MKWSEYDLVPNTFSDIQVKSQSQGHAFSDYRIMDITLTLNKSYEKKLTSFI